MAARLAHLTDRGKNTPSNLTRDPGNPAGYMRYLDDNAPIPPEVRSYLKESLDCYNGGHSKAAVVMVGCAAECLIVNLRDIAVRQAHSPWSGDPQENGVGPYQNCHRGLEAFFQQNKAQFKKELENAFDGGWTTVAYQVRTARNSAGHPALIAHLDEAAHATLVVFLTCTNWFLD